MSLPTASSDAGHMDNHWTDRMGVLVGVWADVSKNPTTHCFHPIKARKGHRSRVLHAVTDQFVSRISSDKDCGSGHHHIAPKSDFGTQELQIR